MQALRDLRAARPKHHLSDDARDRELFRWLDEVVVGWERGRSASSVAAPGEMTRQLAEILDEAWGGASVLRKLSELRAHAEETAASDLEGFVQALPLRSLLPLLLFQLPSLMLVLLWPVLQKLLRDLA